MANVGFHSVCFLCVCFLLLVDFDICHVTSGRKKKNMPLLIALVL